MAVLQYATTPVTWPAANIVQLRITTVAATKTATALVFHTFCLVQQSKT